MEPTPLGGINVQNNNVQKPEKQKRSKVFIQKSKKIITKYWYIFSLLVVLIAAVITWQILESNRAAAWSKASDYFSRAEYEQAAKLIKDFPVPSDPDQQRVYAQTMLATGELDKAMKGYEELYDTNKDLSSKLIIGNIYNQKKEYDKAIVIYEEIVADNPSTVQAYVNMATVYRLQGKNKEAIEVAKKAVDANPQSVTLLELHVSMLLEDQKSEDFKNAVAALRKVNPNDPLLESLKQ